MIVVWTGAGIVVPIIAVAYLLGAEFGIEYFAGNDQYCQSHRWPHFVVALLTAATLWPLGRALREEESHSFFFIPVHWWAIPVLVAGVWSLFVPRDAHSLPAEDSQRAVNKLPFDVGSAYVPVHRGAEDEPLESVLQSHVKLARQLKLIPYAVLVSPSSRKCEVFQALRNTPEVRPAFSGTYVVELDADEWDAELAEVAMTRRALPAIYELDLRGWSKGEPLEATQWRGETPPALALTLREFLHPPDASEAEPPTTGISLGRLFQERSTEDP